MRHFLIYLAKENKGINGSVNSVNNVNNGSVNYDVIMMSKLCALITCFVTVVGSFQLKMLSVRQGTQHFTDENKVSRK